MVHSLLFSENQLLGLISFRIFPFLCQAVRNFAKDRGEAKDDKEYYVSFTDVPTRHKVRELTTAKIGTLIRISGQVVRTHPVHPELVSGTFICLDCQTMIKDVEQQFKVSLIFAFPEYDNLCNIIVCWYIIRCRTFFFILLIIFVNSQLDHQKPQKETCYTDLSISVWLEYVYSPLSLLVLICSFVLGLK